MENQNPSTPVSETSTPLPTEALAKEAPVIPSSIGDPESPNPKPSKKFSLKLVIGIIVFFLLAGGAAASFTVFKPQIMSLVAKPTPTLPQIPDWPSPTTDPTADWKTYINNKYNFYLKYPPTWKIYGSNDEERWSVTNPCDVFHYEENGCPERQDSNVSITVSIEPNPTKMSANEYIKKQEMDLDKFISENKGFDYLKNNIADPIAPIEGRETIFAQVLTVQGPKIKLTQIFDKDRIISIQCDECEKDFNNQILSTFKFTESQTIDTSNWKTFHGAKYTISYPSTWELDTTLSGNIVVFKSIDFEEDGRPNIIKGFSVKVNYGNGCVNNLLVPKPTPLGSNIIQTFPNNKNEYLIEEGFESISYTLIPDRNIDACISMGVPMVSSKTHFTHPTFVQNKDDFIKAGESFKVN